MKYILTYILISLSIFLCAQNQFPRIDKIVVKDRVLHGQIDKYPITIYLKFNRYSNCHTGVYSLKGWYYYDKIKTKIPLSGLSEYKGLTLYSFQDTSKTNELLNFRVMKENHWEDMKYYRNLSSYKEKFVLNDSTCFWTDNKKKFDVSLLDEDCTIRETQELLFIDSTKVFDLHSLGNLVWNFQIVANKNKKFILEYEHDSRQYAVGMCGVGLEKGFVKLEFNESNELLSFQDFVYESCNSSIDCEEQILVSDSLKECYCVDYSNDELYILTVDFKNIEIKKKVTGPLD